MTLVDSHTRAPAEGFTVAQVVTLCRQRVGLSKRGLSDAADLSASYVNKIEAGKMDPSLRCFARIAMALGLSPREIYVVIQQEAKRS